MPRGNRYYRSLKRVCISVGALLFRIASRRHQIIMLMKRNTLCGVFCLFFLASVALLLWMYSNPRELDLTPVHSEQRKYDRSLHLQTPSPEWKQINLEDAYWKFKPITSQSCPNYCDESTNPACKAKTNKDWGKLLAHGQVPAIPLYGETEFLFPYERKFLGLPRLTDVNKLPDLNKTIVYHVDPDGRLLKKSTVRCLPMGQLRFRVDFVDSYGNPRGRGGDEVRVWLKGHPGSPKIFTYRAVGRVEDMHNGSYLATVTCVWAGYATLKIGMAYPWEYIRATLDIFRSGAHLMLAGTFKHGQIEEDTLCDSHPNVPGRPCLCNFTKWNDVPFFCGRPLDIRLSCNDLVSTAQILDPIPPNTLTAAEKQIGDKMARRAADMVFEHVVNIEILTPDEPVPKTPCSKLDKSISWLGNYPTGFWTKEKKWTSLLCHRPELTSPWAVECLKNSNVWIFGDTNALLLYEAFKDLVSCTNHPHRYSSCNTPKTNISIRLKEHEYPVYTTTRKMLGKFIGLRRHFDLIPSTGRHMVIVHYYIHTTRTHPAALYLRMKKLKTTLETFLKRNPTAEIFIWGPHISTKESSVNHMMGGDVLASFYQSSLYNVFLDLRDRVTFLDGWELSVGMENRKYHPDDNLAQEMIRRILASRCQ